MCQACKKSDIFCLVKCWVHPVASSSFLPRKSKVHFPLQNTKYNIKTIFGNNCCVNILKTTNISWTNFLHLQYQHLHQELHQTNSLHSVALLSQLVTSIGLQSLFYINKRCPDYCLIVPAPLLLPPCARLLPALAVLGIIIWTNSSKSNITKSPIKV